MATSSNGAMKLCDNTKDKLQLLVQHGAEGIFQSAIEWYHEKKKKKKKGKRGGRSSTNSPFSKHGDTTSLLLLLRRHAKG